jgi:hypothetical protein
MGIQDIGWKFYLLFCVFNVLAIPFVWFYVKEAKCLSWEEIDVLFAKPECKHILEARLHADDSSSSEKKGRSALQERIDSEVGA